MDPATTTILHAWPLAAPGRVVLREKYGPTQALGVVTLVVLREGAYYVYVAGALAGTYPLANYSLAVLE
jgi:hypothetical protein